MERQALVANAIALAKCQQTYTDTFDTVDYRRQVNEQTVGVVWQSHAEGSSLTLFHHSGKIIIE